jgi:DNA helicase HerA-like ATPase
VIESPVPQVSEPVGIVLGTEDSTPLAFWVGIAPGSYLQLDDTVIVETAVPDKGVVRICGLVQEVRARHEGVSLDSDVFLVDRGVLPAEVAQAALVVATRFEPEMYVPPLPGQMALRARGKDRDEALYLDQMGRRLPAGLSRDGEPMYIDLEFLDGTRGAHVNISGVSGVATKTTYALFLLYALFHSEVLGAYRANTKAIVFNVKGEDLLHVDKLNAKIDRSNRSACGRRYRRAPAGRRFPIRGGARKASRLTTGPSKNSYASATCDSSLRRQRANVRRSQIWLHASSRSSTATQRMIPNTMRAWCSGASPSPASKNWSTSLPANSTTMDRRGAAEWPSRPSQRSSGVSRPRVSASDT